MSYLVVIKIYLDRILQFKCYYHFLSLSLSIIRYKIKKNAIRFLSFNNELHFT